MKRFCNRKAVTIIELMAVLVIIGVFIAMVSPDVASYLKERKKESALDNIKIIREAISSYMSDHRLLPKKSSKKLSLLTVVEKQNLFKLKDYTNSDLYLAFPTCLAQLVKEKYILFIPDNPFTKDCNWEIRGFAESKDKPSSWIKAVPQNGSGKYDGSFVVSDNTPFMPLITNSAQREIDPVTGITAEVIVGAITGIFDVRFGDSTDNYHADIDSWDEKEDGKWKYIPDILENISAYPNEIFMEPGNVVSFLSLIDFVASYTVSPQKSSMAGDFPPDPTIKFSPDPAAGTLMVPDTFTAGAVKGRYLVDVECEETNIIQHTSFYVDISPPVEFITVSTNEITILLFKGFDLNSITVMAKFDGIGTPENVSTDPKLKWTVLSGPGNIINNSAFKDVGTVGDVVVQAEFKGKTQSVIIHIISIVESIYATPNSFTMRNGESLNLNSAVKVCSVYTNFDTEEITPIWTIYNDSGAKGNIVANVYNAPNSGEVLLSLLASYNYNGKIHTTMITIQVLKKLVSISVVPDVLEFKNARISGGFISPHLPADILPPKITVYGRFSDNVDLILPPSSLIFSKVSGSATSSVTPEGIFDEIDPATVSSTTLRVTAFVDGYSAQDNLTINLRHVVTDLELIPDTMKVKNMDSINLEDIGGIITYSDGVTENIVMPDPYLQFIKGAYVLGYFKASDTYVWNAGLGTFEIQSVMTNTFYADTSEIGSISVVGKYSKDNEEVFDTVNIKVYQKLIELTATPDKKTILTGQSVDLFTDFVYNAKYSNSAFDHIALTDLSYELKDDGVNPVIGTMTGSVYNAP
ncbi:MAG: type II secretion system GspH family protein, partial [Candidatus Muirbacterium halophilum]|nr:type II secretion system GspH family protein [Candidatus Muirbacterium halophilum]